MTGWTAPKSFSSRAHSTNYLQYQFLPSMEGSSSERVKCLLALASLLEIRLFYNLFFHLWILSGYSPSSLAAYITLQPLQHTVKAKANCYYCTNNNRKGRRVYIFVSPTIVIHILYVGKWCAWPFLPNSLVSNDTFQENCSLDIFDYLFHIFSLLINFMHQHRHQQLNHWAQKTSASSGTAAGTAAAKLLLESCHWDSALAWAENILLFDEVELCVPPHLQME